MNRDRKRLYAIVGIFAILLLTGIVYAATTGTLYFGGTANFNKNVQLHIVDEAITGQELGEVVQVNPAKDTLTFSLIFDTPGETRNVKFKIENVGNTDAVLGTLSVTDEPAGDSGITVDWPELNGEVILIGGTTSEFTIPVQWSSSYPEAKTEVTMSAQISYSEYTAPEPSEEPEV